MHLPGRQQGATAAAPRGARPSATGALHSRTVGNVIFVLCDCFLSQVKSIQFLLRYTPAHQLCAEYNTGPLYVQDNHGFLIRSRDIKRNFCLFVALTFLACLLKLFVKK